MPFLVTLGVGPASSPACLEDAVDAGRAAGDDVGIEHHEGQAAIAFEGMLAGEDADAFLLVVGEPVIARHPGVVFVDLAEALSQSWNLLVPMPIQGRKRQTGMSVLSAQARTKSTRWSRVSWGTQQPGQSSPRSFFSRVCSSMSSARTSFLRWSLASSCSILWSLASSTALDLRPLSKAAWPFSKNSLSQA